MKKHYNVIIWIVVILSMTVGGLLGILLFGNEAGYAYELVIPLVIGSLVAFGIWMINANRRKKKEGNIPETDERSLLLLKNFFTYALYFVLFVSAAILLVLYGMGIHTIEIDAIFIYVMGLFMLIGFGSLITKRI